MNLTQVHVNNMEALKVIYNSLVILCKVFYSLNFQDLPEFFEDNMEAWRNLYTLLHVDVPSLQTTDEEEASVIEQLKSQSSPVFIETDRGTKEKVRFYDTAGLESLQSNVNNQQLPRHYLGFADDYVLLYDTGKPESLDVLFPLKKDIDKNKDKKEITVIVISN
ncbi:hypothetical protein DBV15_12265 [Temnothorax longispinosus]|uniref:Exportin-2 central domain-containing protein n=1 Tax=Temnothorax longispinosus TaxID=300112 RepID=A0A4S2L1G7_9HYME|nr:hypothetical protein DBV15_12265 [Temnothorax longispinosus]